MRSEDRGAPPGRRVRPAIRWHDAHRVTAPTSGQSMSAIALTSTPPTEAGRARPMRRGCRSRTGDVVPSHSHRSHATPAGPPAREHTSAATGTGAGEVRSGAASAEHSDVSPGGGRTGQSAAAPCPNCGTHWLVERRREVAACGLQSGARYAGQHLRRRFGTGVVDADPGGLARSVARPAVRTADALSQRMSSFRVPQRHAWWPEERVLTDARPVAPLSSVVAANRSVQKGHAPHHRQPVASWVRRWRPCLWRRAASGTCDLEGGVVLEA